VGLWDPDHEQNVPIDWFASHALARQDVGADLLRVLQVVPKVAFDLVDVGNAAKIERSVGAFFGAEDNHSTLGVRHGAVGFPEGFRQLALAIAPKREFRLEIPALVERLELLAGHEPWPPARFASAQSGLESGRVAPSRCHIGGPSLKSGCCLWMTPGTTKIQKPRLPDSVSS